MAFRTQCGVMVYVLAVAVGTPVLSFCGDRLMGLGPHSQHLLNRAYFPCFPHPNRCCAICVVCHAIKRDVPNSGTN